MRISHDGKKLAAFNGKILWIIDVVSGQAQRRGSAQAAAWSADDRRILAIQIRDEGCCYTGRWDLLSYPVEGGEPRPPTAPRRSHGIPRAVAEPGRKAGGNHAREFDRQVWALENFLPAAVAPKK